MATYRSYDTYCSGLRKRTGLSLLQAAELAETSKTQAAKIETAWKEVSKDQESRATARNANAGQPKVSAGTLKKFANVYGVDWRELIHPEDEYWKSDDAERMWAARIRRLSRDAGAPPRRNRNATDPSDVLLEACRVVLDSVDSPMGLLGSNQRVTLANDALHQFMGASSLIEMHLEEMAQLNRKRLTDQADLSPLVREFQKRSVEGEHEILAYVGQVVMPGEQAEGDRLYDQHLIVTPLWEADASVGSLFLYTLTPPVTD